MQEQIFSISPDHLQRLTPYADAEVLASNPMRITDFSTYLSLLSLSDPQKAEHYAQMILNALPTCNWNNLEQVEFPVQSATVLLDELTRTASSENSMDQLLYSIGFNILDGWLNTRFEKSQNWVDSLESIHIVATAAFSESQKVDRIKTWAHMHLDSQSGIFRERHIARLAYFLSSRDPSEENEQSIRSYLSLTNALHQAAEAFGCLEEYQLLMDSIYDTNDQKLDHAIEKEVFPKEYRKAFVQVTKSIKTLYPRYLLLRNFLASATGSTRLIDPERLNQFPYTLLFEPSQLRKYVIEFAGLQSLETILLNCAKEDAKKFGERAIIAPFVMGGYSGYIVVESGVFPGENADEQIAFIIKTMDTQGLDEYLNSKQIELSASDGIVGMKCVDPNVEGNATFKIHIATKQHELYKPHIIDTAIPFEIRTRGVAILEENLQLQRTIARTFTRSLTHRGVWYALADYPEYEGIIDTVALKKVDRGLFAITVNFPHAGEIHATLSMIQGPVRITFPDTLSQVSPDVSWTISNLALKLFQHTCCRPLEEIEVFDDIDSIHDSEEPLNRTITEYPSGFVRVGGYRGDGSPKQYTQQAVLKHLLEVHDIEFGEEATLEDILLTAASQHVLTVVDFNVLYREKFPERADFITWRSASERESHHNPTQLIPPLNLFSY